MTAGMLDFSSLNSWIHLPARIPQILIGPKSDFGQPTATAGRERPYDSRADVLLRILDLARKSPNVQLSAFVQATAWVFNLPDDLPDPFVAIGDDGSIAAEWDVNGRSLHVTFGDDVGEVYFFSPGGDEWESTLDAVDKVSSAMREIALSALAQR